MPDLTARILALPRAQVMEALLALRSDVAPNGASPPSPPTGEIAALQAAPYEHLPEIEDLARAALVEMALDPRHRDRVVAVIENVGRKSLVFGSTELGMVLVWSVVVLQVLLSRGRTGRTTTREVTEKDGKWTWRATDRVEWGIGGKVASILTKMLGGK